MPVRPDEDEPGTEELEVSVNPTEVQPGETEEEKSPGGLASTGATAGAIAGIALVMMLLGAVLMVIRSRSKTA